MDYAIGTAGSDAVWIAQRGQPARWYGDGQPDGDLADAAAVICSIEAAEHPRWIMQAAAVTYPRLRDLGIRIERCHDLWHVETILRNRASEQPPPAPNPTERNPTLFGRDFHDQPENPAPSIFTAYDAQQAELDQDPNGNAVRLLCAADSAGALLAVEMTEAGIPWDAAIHDRLLTDSLGPRPPAGARPRRLIELTELISEAFGKPVNPDSHTEVLQAFAREGIELASTRRWVIREVDHPVVPLLLEYKELARLHSANGWHWLTTWVTDGRFRPGYLPAGVVTGRWAAHGGGALQIPRLLRQAVVADPGKVLVVADAAQLEPRILAAMSRDPGMVAAAGAADMYQKLAAESFDGQRDLAKIGLLGAMYGQVGGQAAKPLQVLRARYPRALALLEDAARTGERGGVVRSHLGRTCPPRSQRDPTPAQERARGRFTRNFVIQATAAEWAQSLLAFLRQHLFTAYGDTDAARIVFFQHDEVVVHCNETESDQVTVMIEQSAHEATRLLFGETAVQFGLQTTAVQCYANAH